MSMDKSDELRAINDYVNSSRSQPASYAPAKIFTRRNQLVGDWNAWYPPVISSSWVSDNDYANGQAKRNAIMSNNDPAGKAWVDATAADIPENRKPDYVKPDAPKYKKDAKGREKTWEDVPLTYPKTGQPKKAAPKGSSGTTQVSSKVEEKPAEAKVEKAGLLGFFSGLSTVGKVVLGLVGVAAVGAAVATKTKKTDIGSAETMRSPL